MIGILLINLGTPDGTDRRSVRRYLRQFLSDQRVIAKSGPLWWLLLNGVIIPRRSRRSARAYELIWNRERDESPLRTITRAQSDKLVQEYGAEPRIMCDWAMRYGKPPVDTALKRLVNAGCDKVLIFPLYPQYSATTSASAMDAVYGALREMTVQPAIRVMPAYFENPAFINALTESIRQHEAGLDWKPERCLMSFHGLPVDFIERGDPYQAQCERSAVLLRERLGRDQAQMPLVYQSRPAGREWLKPYLEDSLVALARDGIRNVTVVSPGFASDCIETLEEVAMRAADTFFAAGGENFSFVPCLNDSQVSIDMLASLIWEQLAGWEAEL